MKNSCLIISYFPPCAISCSHIHPSIHQSINASTCLSVHPSASQPYLLNAYYYTCAKEKGIRVNMHRAPAPLDLTF